MAPGKEEGLKECYFMIVIHCMGFPDRASGKVPANAGDIRDAGLISGSGRSLEESKATHSSILAWRVPWTEEPGGLQFSPQGRKK